MAALHVREDSATGRLTMQSPILPRLGSILFGLAWLVILLVVFLPNFFGEEQDWETLLFIFIFALFPLVTSLGALVTTTVALDRNNRTLTSTRGVLGVPILSTRLSFNDLAKIETQFSHQTSGRRTVEAWRVDAVSRDGKRVTLNWGDREDEMTALAQKISMLTGAPVSESAAKLPTALEQLFKNIVPETPGETEQPEASAPAPQPQAPELEMPDQPTPPPVAAPWAMPPSPPSEIVTETEPAPTANLRSQTIENLEKRIAGDSMDADARYVLARRYHARGQMDRAMALYQETLRLDPTNAQAQNDLGVALHVRGKRAEAEAAYRRAAALDPFSSTVHLNLGLLLRALNRAAEASQELYLARQNARGDDERRAAEAASSGAKMEPRLSDV